MNIKNGAFTKYASLPLIGGLAAAAPILGYAASEASKEKEDGFPGEHFARNGPYAIGAFLAGALGAAKLQSLAGGSGSKGTPYVRNSLRGI